jgi:hypothetical protein
LAGRIY